METVTISSKYQVVIPKKIREKFNLQPGQKLTFIPYQGTIRIVLVPPIEDGRGLLRGINAENLREEDDEERG